MSPNATLILAATQSCWRKSGPEGWSRARQGAVLLDFRDLPAIRLSSPSLRAREQEYQLWATRCPTPALRHWKPPDLLRDTRINLLARSVTPGLIFWPALLLLVWATWPALLLLVWAT